MASNVPNSGDTVVPSANAERGRIFADDASGVATYAIIVLLVGLAILGIVAFG